MKHRFIFLLIALGSAGFSLGTYEFGHKRSVPDLQNQAVSSLERPSLERNNFAANAELEKLQVLDATTSNLANLESECLGDCLERILQDLMASDLLTKLQKHQLLGNPENLIHYISYKPEILESLALSIFDQTPDHKNTQNLDDQTDLTSHVIAIMPREALEYAASKMVYDHDENTREAGLMLMGRVAMSTPQSKKVENDFPLLGALRDIAVAEGNPKIRLSAIKILAQEFPQTINSQTVNALSDIMKTSSGEIRGQAIETAAKLAVADSYVISQIEDELRNPASTLQNYALSGLEEMLDNINSDSPELFDQLVKFEPLLRDILNQEDTDIDDARAAQEILNRLDGSP